MSRPDAEVRKRLQRVGVRLAYRNDPDARLACSEDDMIEPVRSRKGKCRRHLELVQPLFLREGGVGRAKREPIGGHFAITRGRSVDLWLVGHALTAVHDLGPDLPYNPKTGLAGPYPP